MFYLNIYYDNLLTDGRRTTCSYKTILSWQLSNTQKKISDPNEVNLFHSLWICKEWSWQSRPAWYKRQNNWFSTRHCFSAFCTIGSYLSGIISHYYAAHWLSFAVIVYHFLSYQEGIIQVPSFTDGNYFSETNHYTVTTNYSFTKCKPFLKMKAHFHKMSNLLCYDYRWNIHHTHLKIFFWFTQRSKDFRGHTKEMDFFSGNTVFDVKSPTINFLKNSEY